MKRPIRYIIGILTILILVLVWNAFSGDKEQVIASQLTAPELEVSGFTRAYPGRPIEFPADFGPHPDFLSEWWYYTGNLTAESGEQFGYQLTIFRRALLPEDQIQERAATWVTEQVYFAHFTLTDVARGEHQAFERFARGAAGLAGAQAAPYQVWLGDWRIDQIEENTYRLQASQDDITLDLTLIDTKGPILQGDQGYSPKGPDPGNASYYYSQTNMQTSGLVRSADQGFQVNGKSWMDHEFSTSALSSDQVGWDWFSIQLDDDTELMLFHIRKGDGSIDPVSSGIHVESDGTTLKFEKDDFEIDVKDEWQSPTSGVAYPAKWAIIIPSIDLILELEPLIADQELNVSFVYWEGAVEIRGQKDGLPVTGFGYVEMTGYADSIASQF